MAYCVNCGAETVPNAKFCQKCGHPTGVHKDGSTRKREFAGKIYKCPNCGEVLKAFEINCPACGYELRDTKASSAVKEFALKLEAIESRREYEKPRGLFAAAEARQRISKTDEQKISLIKSFSVPNSREDMLEFMILATSSMNMRTYDSYNTNVSKSEKEINAAWFSKVQQIYEKAKRSYSTDSTFTEIKALYDSCNEEIKNSKKKVLLKWALNFGPIPILFLVLFVILGVMVPKAEKEEIDRLENIVVEVQEAIDNKEYNHALRLADSIDYQRSDMEMERKWDIQREYWVEKVIDVAASDGLILEYTPTPDVDKVSDEAVQDEEECGDGFVEGTSDSDSNEEVTESNVSFPDSLFTDDETETLTVKNFSFEVPAYYEEEGSKNEYLQYYAEKGDTVVIFSIAYPEESDDNYDVSFDGLYVDNENMIKAVGAMFTDGDVYSHEVFESDYGVKGILYRFTFNQKIDWLTKADGTGYCFCFPSVDDRRWFYVVLLQTNNVEGDAYEDDFINILATIKEN